MNSSCSSVSSGICNLKHPRAWIDRYRSGEYRALLFRDMVLSDTKRFRRGPVILDIGCGAGFDGDGSMQESIAAVSSSYIGIEPDEEIPSPRCCTAIHRCPFEDAPVEPCSVDIAIASFVLEHLSNPERFFTKLHTVLVPGGVFWGFTMDRRHPFSIVSTLAEKLRFKNWWLDRLHGQRIKRRYANYPTFYLANSPAQIAFSAKMFRTSDSGSWGRIGQLDYYLPSILRPIARVLDRCMIGLGLPGSLFVVRLEK